MVTSDHIGQRLLLQADAVLADGSRRKRVNRIGDRLPDHRDGLDALPQPCRRIVERLHGAGIEAQKIRLLLAPMWPLATPQATSRYRRAASVGAQARRPPLGVARLRPGHPKGRRRTRQPCAPLFIMRPKGVASSAMNHFLGRLWIAGSVIWIALCLWTTSHAVNGYGAITIREMITPPIIVGGLGLMVSWVVRAQGPQ